MPRDIIINVDGLVLEAELNDTITARAVASALPVETSYHTWGHEIYFEIPVTSQLQKGQEVVQIGDLGYWPPGKAFCIFYGATPGSTEEEIRPASEVDVIGRLKGDPKLLRSKAVSGGKIKIE